MDVSKAAQATRLQMQQRPEAHWPKDGPCGYEHVQDMLLRLELGELGGEKAHRWLGWAQCGVVAAGAGTLEEMKNINHAA